MITLRPIETHAEYVMVEDVQRQVWPGTDLEVVPLHVLSTAAHNGGLLIGAFDDDRLIGFVFGFLGTDEAESERPALTRLKHCSHMLGVLPEYRDQHIGYLLKLAQREFVVRQGVRLITWTYDPLESRNAHLNIARLGAVCRTYLRDVYGSMSDGLNAGLPSDRFQVDWWVTSNRVKERLSGGRAPLTLESFTSAGAEIINPAESKDNLLHPPPHFTEPGGTFALVEIPYNFQAIKVYDLTLAQAWRFHVREVFETLFANHYLITDVFTESREGRLRSFYALTYSEGPVEL
jgi:predicted GNAT superfamily acetyltransferase